MTRLGYFVLFIFLFFEYIAELRSTKCVDTVTLHDFLSIFKI